MDEVKCCICGAEVEPWPGDTVSGLPFGYGHNPAPVKDDGRACNWCNANVIIPVRLRALSLEHPR